jgi:hypothetical protein
MSVNHRRLHVLVADAGADRSNCDEHIAPERHDNFNHHRSLCHRGAGRVEWHVVRSKSFPEITFNLVPRRHRSLISLLPACSHTRLKAIGVIGNMAGANCVVQVAVECRSPVGMPPEPVLFACPKLILPHCFGSGGSAMSWRMASINRRIAPQ